jgi:hypothetical protein
MPSFRKVRELLERYYCWLLTESPERRAEHFLLEIRARLRQMEWAHSRMLTLEAELEAEARRTNPAGRSEADRVVLIYTDTARPNCETLLHASLPPQPADELRLLLEAYYYSAHRIRDILRDNRDDLPRLSSFEAAGARDVRNHLVEHPTKKSGVLVFSLKCGGPVGPQLKPVRWSLDEEGTLDSGLHENTAEFLSNLARAMSSALEARGVA